MADRIGMALRLAKEGRTEGFQYLYEYTVEKQLGKATDDGNVLYREACSLFEESWSGEPIRLLGVRTSKLVEEEQPEQLSIFDMQPVLEEARAKKEKKKKHQKLDAVMEQIKRRYGNDVIMRGTDRKH